MKNNIRRLRANLEPPITQEQLAAELHVTRQTIIAIEKGKYDPSLPLALKIARFFQKPVESIFIDDEAGPPAP